MPHLRINFSILCLLSATLFAGLVSNVQLTQAEVKVGVKTGDWVIVAYNYTGWPPGTPYPEWLKVEILNVEGTNITMRVTMHMSDGTEENDTLNADVVGGGESFQGFSGFIIPANSERGDSIHISGYGNVTLSGCESREYAGASRNVFCTSIYEYNVISLWYYWDWETGIIVEASTTTYTPLGEITGIGKVTETNMWIPTPIWMQWWLWTIVGAVIVALIGGIYFLKKRKPPTPTVSPPSKESAVEAHEMCM
jgi:hypothetical protein